MISTNCNRCITVCIIGLVVIIVNRVEASGFGKCPNYPSMPKFNLTKVNFNEFFLDPFLKCHNLNCIRHIEYFRFSGFMPMNPSSLDLCWTNWNQIKRKAVKRADWRETCVPLYCTVCVCLSKLLGTLHWLWLQRHFYDLNFFYENGIWDFVCTVCNFSLSVSPFFLLLFICLRIQWILPSVPCMGTTYCCCVLDVQHMCTLVERFFNRFL